MIGSAFAGRWGILRSVGKSLFPSEYGSVLGQRQSNYGRRLKFAGVCVLWSDGQCWPLVGLQSAGIPEICTELWQEAYWLKASSCILHRLPRTPDSPRWTLFSGRCGRRRAHLCCSGVDWMILSTSWPPSCSFCDRLSFCKSWTGPACAQRPLCELGCWSMIAGPWLYHTKRRQGWGNSDTSLFCAESYAVRRACPDGKRREFFFNRVPSRADGLSFQERTMKVC